MTNAKRSSKDHKIRRLGNVSDEGDEPYGSGSLIVDEQEVRIDPTVEGLLEETS